MTEANHTRIRVLHVVGRMDRGGVETWLMHVLRHIDRDRFQMDFLIHSSDQGAYDEEIRGLGGNLRVCRHTRNPLAYYRALRRVIDDHGPYHIIHSHVHHYSGFILALAKLAGIPNRIAHSHIDTSSTGPSLARRLYQRLAECLIQVYATNGLAASQDAASTLFGKAWCDDGRFRVLYCGVDMAPFGAQPCDAQVRSELGIPEDAFVVGHVGRFDAQKNHSFIVEVASLASRCDSSVFFLLVGEGKLRPGIEQAVANVGLGNRVVFAGSRSDVPALMMKAMDAFLFPSLFEGLPLVLMEAQASGLPILCSDTVTKEVTVSAELITFLSLSCPASWVDAILKHRGSVHIRSSEEAYRLVVGSPFNIANGVKELEQIYGAS